MQVLDRAGVGTLWSICKTKFALSGHTHNYLPLSGGTLTGDLLFSDSGTAFRQIKGTCGGNDFWRIGGGATATNAGYMEIATADDGSEPIYVRQYSGVFSAITRTATLLDANGNTGFPGTVTAPTFKGALSGNASTASNASKVNGHTVNSDVPSGAKFTDTNTWRGIQDNLTSTSTSESLSANQGKVLKGLVDGKANSSHTHTLGQITNAGNAAGKNVRTLNSVSHSSWSSASTDDLYVPTMSFIAYWNGAYNSSGNSNLQYCSRGKFGALAVKDTADWSQVVNKPATATRWPSWGEVTSKPELKSWSETKSYIDDKVNSANTSQLSMLTIHGYLQNQMNSYGLKVGCIHTKTSNISPSNARSFGRYIYSGTDIVNTSNNKSISSKDVASSRLFYKYFIYHGEDSVGNISSVIFADADSGKIVKTINVSAYPAIISTPDHLYISYGSGRYNNTYLNTSLTVIIVDKNLSTKTATYNGPSYVPTCSTESVQYVNLGDEGVVVGIDNYMISTSEYNFIIYKNGSFVKKTCHFTDLKYHKNGHSYDFSDIGELVTDSISLKPGTGLQYANNTTNVVVCILHNLINNTTSKILVPIDCFNFDSGNAMYSSVVHSEKYYVLCFYSANKMDNNNQWLIRIYKE